MNKSTIYKWAAEGFIPSYRMGKAVRFSEKEVESWLKKRRVRGRC